MTVIKTDESLEQCQSEFTELYADVPNNECSFKESLSDANTDTKAENNLKTYRNRQLDPEGHGDCETDKTSINETSDTQEVNLDHEYNPSSFKNLTSIILNDNESDIENNIFDKLFTANDVSPIDDSWNSYNFFKARKKKFILDEVIYKTMTKLNMTSELFVTGGFRKPNARKNLFESNYEREKDLYLQFHKPYGSTWVVTTDFGSINLVEGEAIEIPRDIIFIHDSFEFK